MSETKFTPGPWRVEEPDEWPFRFGVFSADDRVVVEVIGPHASGQKTLDDWRDAVGFDGKGQWSREAARAGVAQTEANVRLLAAAPELLEALEPFAEFLATAQHETADDDLPVYVTERMIDEKVKTSRLTMGMFRAARAAIKKARGEK